MQAMTGASPGVFVPAFAGYAERVRDSFARQGAMALIGAALADIAPGYCAIALEPRPEVSQQHGYVHAGILATLVDSAGGYAAFTLFPPDTEVLTVEYKINLLAPAGGDHIEAVGTVVKAGRTLTICRLEVFAGHGEQRSLVAVGQQTLICRPPAIRAGPRTDRISASHPWTAGTDQEPDPVSGACA